jgi:WD40 repeat protein
MKYTPLGSMNWMGITMRTLLPVLIVLGFALRLAGAEDQPRVIYPAIEIDERPRTNEMGASTRPVELVVIGPCKHVGIQDPGADKLFEVEVQKVLYGGVPAGRTLQFQWGWDVHSDVPRIFALAPTANIEDALWEFRYSLDLSEEKAQAALAVARLDYHVLSAESIFIGNESKPKADFPHGNDYRYEDDYKHTVEVQRVIAGTSTNVGDTVIVEIDGYMRNTSRTPRVSSEAQIYIIDKIITDKHTKRTKYHARCRQPVEQEQAIKEALTRRNDYPVVEVSNDGTTTKVREIVFRGSVADAIDLLGSGSEGAVSLGARMLLLNRQTALEPVFKAAEQSLFAQSEAAPGAFRRLHNLIRVLHGMAKAGGDNRVAKLLEQHLTYLAGTPPEPPPLSARPYWDEQEADGNRALSWLLGGLDDGERLKFGESLLKLRGSVSAGWKARIQDALDETNMEDTLALVEQFDRSKNVQPLRSPQGIFQDGAYVVAFSPDGNLLATVGMVVRIWDTHTWAKLSEFKTDCSISRVSFSPDSKHLFIAGGGGGIQIHGRFDWRTGKADPAFSGHHTGIAEMELSADAKVMATSSFYEDKLHLWNTGTGAILRSIDLSGVLCDLALSPDGKTLIHETGERLWQAESVLDGTRIGIDLRVDRAAFSPDGRHLVTIEGSDRYAGKPVCRIEVREPTGSFKIISSIDLNTTFRLVNGIDAFLSLSPDGQRLAIILSKRPDSHPDFVVAVLSLPDLKTICSMEIPSLSKEIYIESAAFSPDGKILALAKRYAPPLIFDATTGQRILPTPEYQPNISEAHFSADGKILCTVSTDTVCTWDAQTLKQRTRVSLPANHLVASTRPDGKYVFCRDTTTSKAAKVLEVDTGRVVCDVAIELDPNNPAVTWLNDQDALYCAYDRYGLFNYLTGKVAREGKIEGYSGGYYLATTGELLQADGGLRGGNLHFSTLDLATGKVTKLPGELHLPGFTGNERMLVPGDRYYCIADPGFYLCEWRTLTLVASRPLTGLDLLGLTFSGDGSLYAIVAGSRIFVDEGLRQYDRKVQSTLRVYETLSGKMVFAFPTATRWVHAVTFSPDGKRLALVNEDSTLEIWPILEDDRGK